MLSWRRGRAVAHARRDGTRWWSGYPHSCRALAHEVSRLGQVLGPGLPVPPPARVAAGGVGVPACGGRRLRHGVQASRRAARRGASRARRMSGVFARLGGMAARSGTEERVLAAVDDAAVDATLPQLNRHVAGLVRDR